MKKLLSTTLILIISCILLFAVSCTLLFAAGEPKYEGTLTVGIEAEPPLLDPHFIQSNLVLSLIDLHSDHLWRWDHEFSEFVPHVAESWKWIDDMNLKVYVRRGVKFHNGREVKGEDVKYSIDRVLDPKTASPSAALLEPIKKVTVDSEYSLTITLKNPWFGLQDVLARHGAIVPKEAVEKYGDLKTHPVGCGPFVFESWEPGLQMKFKKFDDYYKGKPYLDEVVIRFMPEYSTAKSALLAREIDLINWPDSADVDSLKANKDLELFFYNVNAIMYICINTKSKPLDNPLVRKAIALATNRDAYNDALYRGMGKPSCSPIPSSQPYHKEEWEYERDIEKAKKLLAEAGYPNGFKIRILALKGSEEIMGEVLQANLADIGIEGEITITEIPVALDNIFNKEDFDLGVLGDIVSPDPDFFLTKYMVPSGGAAGATGRWDNARVQELIEKGRGTIDMNERIKIYQEIYDIIILKETPMIFLAWPVRHPVYRKYVKGWFAWGDIRYDWRNVWLDK